MTYTRHRRAVSLTHQPVPILLLFKNKKQTKTKKKLKKKKENKPKPHTEQPVPFIVLANICLNNLKNSIISKYLF